MLRNKMTISEAAAKVGVGPWTLRDMEAQNRIHRVQRDPVSRVRVYTEEDVAAIKEALGLGVDHAIAS